MPNNVVDLSDAEKLMAKRRVVRMEADAHLDSNWNLLAASAWEGFTRFGRGVVCYDPVNDSEFEYTYLEPRAVKTLFEKYVSDKTLGLALLRVIEEYSPETEVVFIFNSPNGNMTYCGPHPDKDGLLDPPIAYETLVAPKLKKARTH